ncbi:MAG: hypothetical protein COV67_12580 [Nitrospinae bacterium CG11_big_fil_rev_8_21_14_0_20_56_8]|nr:MAG: hypothetical protein COV67_12580 [Nitrospinae bacterium CG11_big_fil_rev_8_21_14_0_20_56_8]
MPTISISAVDLPVIKRRTPWESLGVNFQSPETFLQSLPFSLNDTTAGSETELQTVVMGEQEVVDLPLTIRESNYFSNLIKRFTAGELPRGAIVELEQYLNGNKEQVWENSWVRFPKRILSALAAEVLQKDLLSDKRNPAAGLRPDAGRFFYTREGEEFLRIPFSYLLKLALADVLGEEDFPRPIWQTGFEMMERFANDNTSPETHSFYVTQFRKEQGNGKAIARETSLRFLMTQVLTLYSNEKFLLKHLGQRAVVFFSPHPPFRQKKLNECISDGFYRELFMSPCLSGWDRGMEKHDYMRLCHEVLSRSQLNTLVKLKDVGIINQNLVCLPNISNISLANNGTHLSLGSRRLTEALKNPDSGFTEKHEKYYGDLAIKIVEHFLPLFVGTYSAAPYRLEFQDFHPEKVLGFLPHQLHNTHLRMIWRRWKKKAKLKIFNRPVTPFGPLGLDRALNWIFGFQGDYVADFRLIDYMAALLSTESCPALDGTLGNEERLKNDLMEMGVFDRRMSLYLFYKLRRNSVMGFSGFEGRHYSLFESLPGDMGQAANLQQLVTLLAFKWIVKGEVGHEHIPDTPFIESERRQIMFGASIGIPTFYVRDPSPNVFLQKILSRVKRIRSSRRYPGYLRIHNLEYKRALVDILEEEGKDLVEMLGLETTLPDLRNRLEHPEERSVFGRITASILDEAGARSPFALNGEDFNFAAERYYRETLRVKHLLEGIGILKEGIESLRTRLGHYPTPVRRYLKCLLGEMEAGKFLERIQTGLLSETLSPEELRKLVFLILLYTHDQIHKPAPGREKFQGNVYEETAPVY